MRGLKEFVKIAGGSSPGGGRRVGLVPVALAATVALVGSVAVGDPGDGSLTVARAVTGPARPVASEPVGGTPPSAMSVQTRDTGRGRDRSDGAPRPGAGRSDRRPRPGARSGRSGARPRPGVLDVRVLAGPAAGEEGNAARPTWSPDGRWIVFDWIDPDDRPGGRLSPAVPDVWIMRPDGTDRRCLTCDHEALGMPVGSKGGADWHPSGDWIVMTVEKPEHFFPQGSPQNRPGAGVANDIWIVRTDGSEAHLLYEVNTSRPPRGTHLPRFDRTGRWLAWSEYQSSQAEVGDWLTDPSSAPTPTNYRNRFAGVFEIKVAPFFFDADGTPRLGEPRSYQPGAPGVYELTQFTDDGASVLLAGNPDEGQPETGFDVLVMRLSDGAITRRLTDSWDEWDALPRAGRGGRIGFNSSRDLEMPEPGYPYPTLSAPGSHLLTSPRSDLWVAEPDDTQWRLTFFNDPDWEHRPAGMPVHPLLAYWEPDPAGRRLAVTVQSRAEVDGTAVTSVLLYESVILIELDRPL